MIHSPTDMHFRHNHNVTHTHNPTMHHIVQAHTITVVCMHIFPRHPAQHMVTHCHSDTFTVPPPTTQVPLTHSVAHNPTYSIVYMYTPSPRHTHTTPVTQHYTNTSNHDNRTVQCGIAPSQIFLLTQHHSNTHIQSQHDRDTITWAHTSHCQTSMLHRTTHITPS